MEKRADKIAEILAKLRAGAGHLACGGYLGSLDPLHLTDLLTQLVYDRLKRKCEMVDEIYRFSGQNWNQTFYALLFRYIGDLPNRETYMELARRATYTMVLRERPSRQRIEALLFGTSGWLSTFRPDDYVRRLRSDFDYFQSKYGIDPIELSRWKTTKIRPNNAPHLRIAQLASFLAQHNFVFEQVLACQTRKDVYDLFSVEAAPYWSGNDTRQEPPKRVGQMKSDIFGINLAAILQYAYGSYIQDEGLRDRAFALLECIPPEENQYITRWRGYGLEPQNAFDTQALLQLALEYCAQKRCDHCPVAGRVIDKIIRAE